LLAPQASRDSKSFKQIPSIYSKIRTFSVDCNERNMMHSQRSEKIKDHYQHKNSKKGTKQLKG
jgi:hypothetical protein